MTDKSERLARPMIAIDMDHVMADTGAYLCNWLNAHHGTDFSDESFATLRQKTDGDVKQAMMDHVAEGELMRDLPLFPGCVETVRELNERFAVVICTAAMEYPNTMAPKLDWLEKHFPFLDTHLFVFCGYKQVMGTDYLIDDSPKHFPGFKGTPLLYTAPHNLAETRYERVSNWSEIADYFATR